MNQQRMSRREFLYAAAMTAAGAAIVACQPQTVVVKETVEVEKEVEKVVKETVEVEKEVEKVVEKEVTKIIEKEVTPTPLPSEFKEAPQLAEMVSAGTLPAADERLPESPIVVEPWEEIGQYGHTWQMVVQVDPNSHVYELLKYEPLLRYSPGGLDVLPNLAVDWEVTENGTAFVFNLRKGVKWADGTPFTADDVVFHVEDILGNKELYGSFPTWLKAGGEPVTVSKMDDYTVRFSYSNPAPFFVRQMGYPNHEVYHPKHYLVQFHAEYVDASKLDATVKESGFDNWASLFLDREDHDTNPELPMMWGWQLEALEEDGAAWDRNAYYWKVDPEGSQLPYIDRVESRVAANIEVAQMMAFSGEAELQTFAVGQFPADTMILKKNAEMGNYRVIDAPISEPNVCVFGLNLTVKDDTLREVFRDKRFRFALSHAINREDIRELVYLGQPIEIRQCAPLPGSPYYHEGASYAGVEYDPAKANELLDEMGFTERDGDGYRLGPDGQPIAFTMEIIGKRNDFIDALEMVADWWNEVGIKATAKATETSLYFTRLNGNELHAGVDYSGYGMFPVLGAYDYIPLSSGAVWAPDWGIWYASGGESGEEPPEEVKQQLALYDEIQITPDLEQVKELWMKIMDINAENLYHFGICDRASVPTVVSNKFRNVPDTGWNIAWEAGNVGTTNPCQYWKAEP